MVRKQVATRFVGLETIVLELSDDGPQLRNEHTGVALPVSNLEANAFLWSNDSQFHRFFIEQGGLNINGQGATSRLGAIAAGLSHGLPISTRLVCFVDRTTLENASAALEWDTLPNPAALMDLSTLCYSVILYDHIASDVTSVSIPNELKEIVLSVQLRVDPSAQHPHYGMAASIDNMLQNHPEFINDLTDSWGDFLNRPVEIHYRYVDRATSSPGVWNYLPGDYSRGYDPIEHLAARYLLPAHKTAGRDLNRDVSIQTWRYFVNERSAALLGLPYNCTSLRFPIERVALRRRMEYRWLADQLLTSLLGEPERSREARQHDIFAPRLRLAHPLSVIVGRTARREAFWSELLQLREEFRPVRERLLRGRAEGVLDGAIVQRLANEITRASNGRVSRVDGYLVPASAIAGALPIDAGAASVSLKIASTLAPIERAQRVIERLVKPELHVLRSFVHEATALATSVEDIGRLWSGNIDRAWFDAVQNLNDITTLNAAKFR